MGGWGRGAQVQGLRRQRYARCGSRRGVGGEAREFGGWGVSRMPAAVVDRGLARHASSGAWGGSGKAGAGEFTGGGGSEPGRASLRDDNNVAVFLPPKVGASYGPVHLMDQKIR